MKVFVSLLGVVMIFLVGCASKEDCLKKYHYDSCDEFKTEFAKVKDNDEALKMHSISIECGCKPDQQ